MAIRGYDTAQTDQAYTPRQVEAVLNSLGVEIIGETYHAFTCYCPFHHNISTYSFNVDCYNGLFNCFNPSCEKGGTLVDLVCKLSNRNMFEAMRFINKKAGETKQAFELQLQRPKDFEEIDPNLIDRLKRDINGEAIRYLRSRKFNKDTIEYFDVGYSKVRKMITVPLHSPFGMPVGLIGRSIESKEFHNSRGLPRSRTLFNLHRAKKIGSKVIVTEASFDAMRVHQSGFPCVVATLGGNMSPENFALLDRHFDTIVIMTDFDKLKRQEGCSKCKRAGLDGCAGHNAGRDLGQSIAMTLSHKKILWAAYDHKVIYPNGKDAGDIEDDQIKQCIENAVSHLEYSEWQLY